MMSDKAEKMLPNILKVRDDHQPVRFEKAAEDGRFKICDGFDASWAGEEFGPKELRGQIEPWLTALFQSEHLSLLAGSGLTHAVHYLGVCRTFRFWFEPDWRGGSPLFPLT